MIDIKFLRENPDAVKENIKKKFQDQKLPLVDEVIELDAEKVLSIPRKIRSVEVVRRGFMSDFLFQNISRVFNASAEITEIISKIPAVKEVNLQAEVRDANQNLFLDD